MLLHTSSSLLRAWGYFFPVCYWGATFEMQPGLAHGIETSAPGLPRNPQGPSLCSVFNSQRWVECSRSFNHFSTFLSSAGRGTGRDKLDFSLIWNPERLGWPHSLGPGLFENQIGFSSALSWREPHQSPLWPNVNSPEQGRQGRRIYFNSVEASVTDNRQQVFSEKEEYRLLNIIEWE